MREPALALVPTVIIALSAAVGAQSASTIAPGSKSTPVPSYRVSFERREPIPGISATGAIELPFLCTSDGTFFVNFVGTVPAGGGIQPPLVQPALLTSVSPSGRGHTFRLDQVPELYVSREKDHFASDSEVIFLVRASRENKPVKRTYRRKDGSEGEYEDNSAPQHLYILSFTREGEYRRTTEIGDTFSILRLGVFPRGTFLAFGFEEKDHSPRLAMLTQDGTFLKSLTIPAGDAPQSMVGGADARHPHAVAPAELVPSGHSILIVQNNTTFPLLEVGEGGAIRAIRPHLPDGQQIRHVIPANQSLYVIAGSENAEAFAGTIYEVSPEDGALLKRFELSDGREGSEVACVHDGKFLSLDYGDGKVIPVVGTAEVAATAAGRERNK